MLKIGSAIRRRTDEGFATGNDWSLLARGGGGSIWAPPTFEPGPSNPMYGYTENSAPLPIAPEATLSDPNSPTLGGGSLLLSLTDVRATDQLGVRNQGSGAGEIGVSGANVSYGGVIIGTVSGGALGGATIAIALNGDATPAAVQALVRNVTYWNSSDNPSGAGRNFTLTVNDGSGGEAQISRFLNVYPAADAPVIANLQGDVATFSAGMASVLLDQGAAAVVSDVDNTDFPNGRLTVAITQNRIVTEDLFGIATGTGVSVFANNVSVGGTIIGTVEGYGTVGSDLTFRFNGSATPALVTQVVDALTYTNTNGNNPSLQSRTVTLTLNDGSFILPMGGGQNAVVVTVQINVTGGTPTPPPSPPVTPTVFTGPMTDSVLSPDGLRLYAVSQSDSLIRVYRAETGAFITGWDAGQLLGGIDLSLDGTSLIALGVQIVGNHAQGVTVATYKADLATGAVTQFRFDAQGSESVFRDAAFLDNGLVLLAQGSSNSPNDARMKLLDIGTGQYMGTDIVSGALYAALDGNRVFVVRSTIAAGIYDADTGFTQSPSVISEAATAAYSAEAGLIVTAQHGAGLTVYDGNGQFQMQLTQYLSLWSTEVGGLAFDSTGAFLFVLDSGDNAIYQLRTSDWAIVNTIAIATPFDSGTDLQIGPDMRYFTFNSTLGLVRADNPYVANPIVGTLGADNLVGTSGNDILIGDSGADVMTGGGGDDIYYAEAGDTVVETAGSGYDTIRATTGYTLASDVEIERLAAAHRYGTSSLSFTGNAIANWIDGNNGRNVLRGEGGNDTLLGLGGNDHLDGGSGADSMDGGLGNDTYIVDNAGDQVLEAAGEGGDAVYSAVTYTLGSGQEIETLSALDWNGTASLSFTGNEFANWLIGNAGANVLNGGGGADILQGRGGNDVYIVDHAGDQPFELAGEGNDAVYSTVSYTLASGQEIETLSSLDWNGTASLSFTGNELANWLIGNAGANVLNGGGGADILQGRGGNDIYIVDHAGDQVFENAGEGNDGVYSTVSYTLASGQEIETLSSLDWNGTASLNFTGNELANYIIGNAGANVLDGKGGADVLVGRGGDDIYIVESSAEIVYENAGEGADAIYTSASYALNDQLEVENLSTLDWNSLAAIDLTGNALGNYMIGNAGANVLNGKGGNDVLVGKGGADTFAFTTAAAAGNVDLVADFQQGLDKLALDDAVFAGIGTAGSFNANAFVTGSAAQDADDRIVYNQATGQLFYDADGNGAGAAVLFATLSGAPTLGASDFQVI